jgi:threonine synthase
MLICTICRRPYPEQGAPHCCPHCGGLFDFAAPLLYDQQQLEAGAPGIWRYRHALGLEASSPLISLGEGQTPLLWIDLPSGERAALKCEHQNPTGSFKDRGSALIVSFLKGRGVMAAVEDSSGNAGASFAAYAARAGLKARIYLPDAASGPKRAQILAYGAEAVRILGPRSNATRAARAAVEAEGLAYASHAFLPHNLAGYATAAYELFAQLGEAPGTLVAPAGQGGLLLGLGRGFVALQRAGLTSRLPRLVGVQARACAPLWAVAQFGAAGLSWVSEGETLAEGIRVVNPLRGDAVLQQVQAMGGLFVAVDEADIRAGRDELARRGFYVEPTAAVVWPALLQLRRQTPEPLVAILTGSGLKTG